MDRVDRGDKVLGRGVLEQEAGRTGLDGPHDVTVGVEGGQDDDPPGDAASHELASGGQAVETRHLHIEQEHVDRVSSVAPQGIIAVNGLPDDLHVRLRSQQHGQSHGEQRFIIGQAQADHRRLPSSTSTHRQYPPSVFQLCGFAQMKSRHPLRGSPYGHPSLSSGDGELRRHPPAALGRGAGREGAIQIGHPVAHSEQAEAPAPGAVLPVCVHCVQRLHHLRR